jgi:UDP-glucose 4-epimerase
VDKNNRMSNGKESILVTGGAGYIASVMVELLLERGIHVVVVDDLSRGHRAAVPEGVPFYEGQVGDTQLVERIAREHSVGACMHFAAFAYVGESMIEPARYFQNNTAQGIALVGALIKAGVRRFILSSTCTTYGEQKQSPILEDAPQWPANPYGWSKLILERMLASYSQAYDFKFAALRYFNAAGATARCGEHHEPDPHLIPNVLAAAAGERPDIAVFGNDYPTPDGTAIRDYVHVSDLADAHLSALDYLERGGTSDFFNLGTGQGYSVLQVIEAARAVTGATIPVRLEGRRTGDPPSLVADATKARVMLGWRPGASDIQTILLSQWNWKRKLPRGYAQVRFQSR